MKWYAAHLVFYFKRREGKQRSYPVWENIVLIRARDDDDAFAKAEERGRKDPLGDDGSILWGGVPAEMIFAGVRKLTTCQEENERPGHGTEVSYIEMELESERAIKQLVAGKPVSIKLTDGFPEEVGAKANGVRHADVA